MSILLQLVKPSVRLIQRRAIPASVHAPRTAYSTGNGFDTIIATEKGPEVADTALPTGAQVEKEPIAWQDHKWSEMSRNAFASLVAKPVPDAVTGRYIKINNSNVMAAFAKLSGVLKANNVMYELRKTRRHEKKGVKRRRLASETWRRVFAHEVRRNVQLVAKIRSRGA
ncbi:hypothetical protein BDZ89DRAFT_289182 [Hymenopellis radicata]|nr:hypothetical protein BDZ89DRAFT_289182 [Hymenopellis radicata]